MHLVPAALANLPAAQRTQALAPLAEMEPTGQVKQLVAPVLAWYLPAAQDTHPFKPFWLYLPAGQPVHMVKPVEGATAPARQGMQRVAPKPAW